MAINTKSDICNLAISSLGNYPTISDIDTPVTDPERTFSLWYDICREFTLKLMMPNFALARTTVAKLVEVPPFGYSYYYEYPNNCLKLLGVGDVKDKENNYNVEENKIAHDTDYDEGMPIRFIKKVTDVNSMSPEYVILLSQYLAAYTCVSVTQDAAKAKALKAELPALISSASGLNAQENMPIRISSSRFRQARFSSFPQTTDKK